MATYSHTHRGHRLRGDRIINIVLSVVTALVVVAGAAVVWDWASSGASTGAGSTVDTVGPSAQTLDHAARMAQAGRQLNALRAVGVSSPSIAPSLVEDIATLELVVTGRLPVEVVERMPVAPAQP